jgi:hypothetical protein
MVRIVSVRSDPPTVTEPKEPLTPTGWPIGKRLRARDGTRYIVHPSGSFINVDKQPGKLSKKQRNRIRRAQ